MSRRTRIVVVAALAAAALPAVLLARSWPSRGAAAPARGGDAAAPRSASAAPVPSAGPPQPGVAAVRPLPPRAAAYLSSRARAVPRPVRPGDAPEGEAPKVGPLPPAPPPSEWAEVEIVNPWGVGSPSPAVTKEIQATLRPRLAACFERLAEAGWRGLGRSYSTVAPVGEPGRGPAILVLEVEADGTGVKVVDAPVEARGSVGDGTLNCAQSVLRGAKLQARGEGNARFRMRYALRR